MPKRVRRSLRCHREWGSRVRFRLLGFRASPLSVRKVGNRSGWVVSAGWIDLIDSGLCSEVGLFSFGDGLVSFGSVGG